MYREEVTVQFESASRSDTSDAVESKSDSESSGSESEFEYESTELESESESPGSESESPDFQFKSLWSPSVAKKFNIHSITEHELRSNKKTLKDILFKVCQPKATKL